MGELLDPIETAQAVSRDVLAVHAPDVDAKNRFPAESVEALWDSGLMSLLPPPDCGGRGADLVTFTKVAARLGEGCLSSAFIWTQHGQQVAMLAEHGNETERLLAKRICAERLLTTSVTTEAETGGSVLQTHSALAEEGSGIRLCRSAPVVGYGKEADFYLITMRAGPDARENETSLLIVPRGDGMRVTGDWQPMGMRGTRSIPMEFDLTLPKSAVFSGSFRAVAVQTMFPLAHLGWAAAWCGAARSLFRTYVKLARGSGQLARKLQSDLFVNRLGRIRMSVDLVECICLQAATQLDELRRANAPMSKYEDPSLTILVNNVKLAGSTLCFQVADELMELGGLGQGYLQTSNAGIERVFRDLRSAPLMFRNDRLLAANGKLTIMHPVGSQM